MAGQASTAHRGSRAYAVSLARGVAGALIFAFPLVMTMEMWSIGFSVTPPRLLLFLVLGLGVLAGLAYYSGFEPATDWLDALLDALVAFAIGLVGSGLLLWLFGIVTADLGWHAALGMVALQAVPAGMGAVAARRQFGARPGEAREDRAGYPAQLFLMLAGALFLAFNVAPTEEVLLIALRMRPVPLIGLMALSLLLLHLLVYTIGFAGQERRPEGAGLWRTFCAYTLAGYGLALAVSFYALWTFGRADLESLPMMAMATVVLGFPAALGAAIARLVV
ncbi:TIGR02587 family membrane protein [Roseomonas sp. 18066]|uniref:TIGR02587 family membrane protein n=1 Tax=Roseomonas sp. 18066 TaxID=2681412 RepID=UPI00135B1526|nr:TIGR02587 family membrane protein [Roseomonas sp. 18066]